MDKSSSPVLFYCAHDVPEEQWEHMASHAAFNIVMGVLIFATHNPACAIGLFVTLFFSTLYHLAMCIPNDADEKKNEKKAKWVNFFSILDYFGIVSGVTIALVWNMNRLAAPSPWTWSVFFLFNLMHFYENKSCADTTL